MDISAIHTKALRENKRTSAIITAIIALLLLFILIYPFINSVADEELIGGIEVRLGNIDTESSGEEMSAAPSTSEDTAEESINDSAEAAEESNESEPIAAAEPAAASTKKDVATAEDSSVNINKKKDDKKKADDAKAKTDAEKKAKAEAKKKAEAAAKKKAEEEAKKKAAEEKRRKEEALKNAKDGFGDFLGGGDGNDDTAAGQENGNPNASALEGISSGIGIIGKGLDGRDVVATPNIKNDSQAEGKVVVKICVNSEGKVISSEVTQNGTNTSNRGLWKAAKEGVKGYKFSPGIADKQCGTITVNFKLK